MRIQTSTTINAPAEAAWHVLGEQFADISKWFDGVTESSIDGDVGEGATRTCKLPSGEITELLTHFSRESLSLTYAVSSGLPSFMGEVENAWTIEVVDDNRCRVTSVVTADLAWFAIPMTPLLRMNLGRTIRGLLEQLDERAGATA
jgi:hypothetical protein